jgi:hypothetical protein
MVTKEILLASLSTPPQNGTTVKVESNVGAVFATMAMLGVASARSARASAANHPKHQRSLSMTWV